MLSRAGLTILLLISGNATIAGEETAKQPSASQPLQFKFIKTDAKSEQSTKFSNDLVKPNEQTNYATVKLSPQMRIEEGFNSKYSINLENILPHLKNSLVFDRAAEFKNLPIVVKHIDDSLLGAEGNQFFAQGLAAYSNNIYTILRQKNTYIQPDTQENLGTEFVAIGTAKVVERGKNLIKMEIVQSNYSIEKGDRLTPRLDLDLPVILNGKVPDKSLQGYILAVEDGLWDMGKYNSVMISLGKRDNMEQGHVLNIFRMNYRKDLLPDKKYKRKRKDKKAEKAEFVATKYGELIIYKVFDKVSLCIVIDAKSPLTVLDVVKSDVVEESEECPS